MTLNVDRLNEIRDIAANPKAKRFYGCYPDMHHYQTPTGDHITRDELLAIVNVALAAALALEGRP